MVLVQQQAIRQMVWLATHVGRFAMLAVVACSYTATLADDRNSNGGGRTWGAESGGMNTGGKASSAGAAVTGGSNFSNPNRAISPQDLTRATSNGCTAAPAEPETSNAKLALVVDVSGSMTSAAPGSIRSKWEVTRDALLEAIVGVQSQGLPASTSVGLLFYPNKINNDLVPSAPVDPSVCVNTDGETGMAMLGDNRADSQRVRLRQQLSIAVLGRGTPTLDAYNWALRSQLLSTQQRAVPGQPYLLLITDGVPTLNEGCWNANGAITPIDDGRPIVEAIEAAYAQGVKTFVIGSPGSDDGRWWFSRAAFAGGTALPGCNPHSADGPYCHLDLTTAADFSAALRQALVQVTTNVAACEYDLTAFSAAGATLPDLDKLAPVIRYGDGKLVLVGKSPTPDDYCLYGYRIVNETKVRLCSSTCASMRGDTAAKLTFVLGCSVDELLPP